MENEKNLSHLYLSVFLRTKFLFHKDLGNYPLFILLTKITKTQYRYVQSTLVFKIQPRISVVCPAHKIIRNKTSRGLFAPQVVSFCLFKV